MGKRRGKSLPARAQLMAVLEQTALATLMQRLRQQLSQAVSGLYRPFCEEASWARRLAQ